MFRIEMETDNAAFEGADAGPELARILTRLAERVEDGVRDRLAAEGALCDSNGNMVGRWTYVAAADDEADAEARR